MTIHANRPSAVPDFDHPDVVICPGGPLLLRGKHLVEDADGNRHETTRRVSAVCRCEHTATPPWCDGTHRTLRRSRRAGWSPPTAEHDTNPTEEQ